MNGNAICLGMYFHLNLNCAFLLKSISISLSTSVRFSRSVMSNSLWPHGLQYTRFLCHPLSPGVRSNSYPLSRWCYLTISSSATLISFCLQSYLEAGSFPMSWLLAGGQSIRASATVLPKNIQGWFPLGLTGLISLLSEGLQKVFSSTTVWKHQFFGSQLSLLSNSHVCT